MSTPFLAELKIIAWNYAPKGWAFANGQFLSIAQNQALFSILGTTYGGDGRTTFALPDLRGRVPIHTGAGFVLGQAGGQEAHTLTIPEMPAHNHFVNANSQNATAAAPAGDVFAASNNLYTSPAAFTTMLPSTISNAGGSQAHENRQPYLVLNIIIALQGIFPSQN